MAKFHSQQHRPGPQVESMAKFCQWIKMGIKINNPPMEAKDPMDARDKGDTNVNQDKEKSGGGRPQMLQSVKGGPALPATPAAERATPHWRIPHPARTPHHPLW